MKICILGDTHFGMRGDSLEFHRYYKKFYDEVFFPYLIENKIDTVFQLGDLFDRRKFINFNSLYLCRKYFFDKLDDALERIKELIEAVIKFGCDEYKENLRTSVTNSTDEKYKDMQSKPSPTCKSWKGYEWFPKKKKWWQVKIAGRTTP